jgi:hypothetical protein
MNLGLEKLLTTEINERTNRVEIKALNEGLINELKSIKPDLNIEDTELPKIAQMRQLALE